MIITLLNQVSRCLILILVVSARYAQVHGLQSIVDIEYTLLVLNAIFIWHTFHMGLIFNLRLVVNHVFTRFKYTAVHVKITDILTRKDMFGFMLIA